MPEKLLDFPQYVEQTEPARQRLLQPIAFDDDRDGLEWTVRDVIEELEYLVDMKATMAPEEFVDGVREQARRLLK
ncbi:MULTISPECIES: hypothetical protein [Brevibacillus]|jgi:hypothetical protein|uniref:hypothetical protein n=1 Tax=Brevibacillus TaxID=55080 RepID=UPI0014913BC2|nr:MULTISPECIES: hypothetical protein [Brevibacillus]MDT3415606.1 hypothetical protein [Brevibacillus aydinogluensis]NNV01932.1 hypothetical protein [Brevibacillus sp. MCWH]